MTNECFHASTLSVLQHNDIHALFLSSPEPVNYGSDVWLEVNEVQS